MPSPPKKLPHTAPPLPDHLEEELDLCMEAVRNTARAGCSTTADLTDEELLREAVASQEYSASNPMDVFGGIAASLASREVLRRWEADNGTRKRLFQRKARRMGFNGPPPQKETP